MVVLACFGRRRSLVQIQVTLQYRRVVRKWIRQLADCKSGALLPWVFDSPLSDNFIIPGSSKGRTIDFGSVDAWFESRSRNIWLCNANWLRGKIVDLVFMSSSLMHHPNFLLMLCRLTDQDTRLRTLGCEFESCQGNYTLKRNRQIKIYFSFRSLINANLNDPLCIN